MFDVLKRITELREAREWSVYRLSRESGIPQSTISTWYSNHNTPPFDKLESLCRAFGISMSAFFYLPKEDAEEPPVKQSADFLHDYSLLDHDQRSAISATMRTMLR